MTSICVDYERFKERENESTDSPVEGEDRDDGEEKEDDRSDQ